MSDPAGVEEAEVDVDRYLARIGFDGPVRVDLATLEALQRAHLSAVPFENLDVYSGVPVAVGTGWSLPKVVERGRGGWCFELNGAFAALLAALGFRVARLGAAVLLRGPTEVVDHLALEVTLDEPWLVDVGFGDGPARPLALNRRGPQDGLSGRFELLGSPRGTTLYRHEGGTPGPQYRFKRVSLAQADFEVASRRLQADKALVWHQRAFATRLLDGGPDRVTLMGRSLKQWRDGRLTETPVADGEWDEVLDAWFGFRSGLPGPPER